MEDTAVSLWDTRRPGGKTGQNQPADKYAKTTTVTCCGGGSSTEAEESGIEGGPPVSPPATWSISQRPDLVPVATHLWTSLPTASPSLTPARHLAPGARFSLFCG